MGEMRKKEKTFFLGIGGKVAVCEPLEMLEDNFTYEKLVTLPVYVNLCRILPLK